MSTLSASEIDHIALRHPAAFRRTFRGSVLPWLLVALVGLYVVFCGWLFDVGSLFTGARWERAGIYLADWVSYETKPTVRIDGEELTVKFPRFDPLGPDPKPDWIHRDGPSRIDIDVGGGSGIVVTPTNYELYRSGERIPILRTADGLRIAGSVPDWIDFAPDHVQVSYGIYGWIDIVPSRVTVSRRYLGWANFLFDPGSRFWSKPLSEVLGLIVSGERLDPARSNLAVAFDDFWNNAEWQHGDVFIKLLQTIVMAFAGTLLAAVLALPLAFVAARNITPGVIANQATKRFFDFLRCVDMLIWALFFIRGFGPGPLAGIAAIFFTDTGTLGKQYTEAIENIDNKQREGIRSVGASPIQVQRYGVMPQVLPVFTSQALYAWESNTRSATIIGAMGAGGIGLKLLEAMRTNQDWENVAYMVILILIVVYAFDSISTSLRRRLVSGGR